jgi:hypothetical protein
MEVMGLMLGEFVDEYTIQVIDVFAMPQSGTTVTVESVDHVFQTKMVEMLKQTGRCVYIAIPFSFCTLTVTSLDPRWWWGGTIHIPDSGAGFRASISIHNRYVQGCLLS